MLDSNAYTKGFCKVAAYVGINPAILLKTAKDSQGNGFFGNMDPYVRRALLSSLISGIGTYMLSDGTSGTRLKKGLTGSLVGGLGMYGLDKLGLTDKGIDLLSSGLNKLRPEPKRKIRIPFIND